VDPLESKGNIYQHASQSIEGNKNCLAAKFGADFGADDFDVSNGEGTERVAVFDRSEDGRGDAIYLGQSIEICKHAAGVVVAIVEHPSCQLLVTVAGVYGKKEWIFFIEDRGESCRGGGVEVRLARTGNAVGAVEGGDHLHPAGLERGFVLAFAFDEDQNFIAAGVGNVTDTLNFGIAQALRSQTAPQPVDVRRLGESHI